MLQQMTVTIQWLAILRRIPEVLAPNIDPQTINPGFFVVFFGLLSKNTGAFDNSKSSVYWMLLNLELL
jgi:hypothetical protein